MSQDQDGGAAPSSEIKCIVQDGVLTVALLPQVYAEFKKDIPIEGLQASYAEETRKGYDTVGYGYAWITERLNDVVGPQCWRMVLSEKTSSANPSKNGNIMHEVSMDLLLQLGNWKSRESFGEKGIFGQEVKFANEFKIERDFEVLAEAPGFGWHKALSLTDARKGAMTNGLKKAAALFGIGNSAYKKSIDEENAEVKEQLKKKGKKVMAEKPQGLAPSAQDNMDAINKALEELGQTTVPGKISFVKKHLKFDVANWNNMTAPQIAYLLTQLKVNRDKLASV